MKPIHSVRDLASRLGFSAERLRQLVREIDDAKYSHYRFWSEINAKTGKVRHFRIPDAELMRLQRRIKANILDKLDLSDAAHGGVRGRSPRSNASPHLNQPCVINLDVKEFFPRVRHYVIRDVFRRELGFGREVTHILTRLMTLDAQLPQGSPSSTAIANILLTEAVDAPLSANARMIDARNTRFVDDLTLSGVNPRSLINPTARALSRKRLPIWRHGNKAKPKFKIVPNSKRQEVTGLVVNGKNGPSVSRPKRDGIRAAILQAAALSNGPERVSALNSINGRLVYLRRFNPGSADRLDEYLRRMCEQG
jgi:RNA-directed DNA polymerase